MIKILITDDSDTIAALLKSILEKEPDMQVIGWAKNGRQAVEMSRKLMPDLITMDIRMPVMDGFDAIKLLKQDERTKNIPIIILSNLGQRDEVENGLALGAVDYFVKIHYTPSDLIEKIKYHLGDSKK